MQRDPLLDAFSSKTLVNQPRQQLEEKEGGSFGTNQTKVMREKKRKKKKGQTVAWFEGAALEGAAARVLPPAPSPNMGTPPTGFLGAGTGAACG